MKAIRIIGAAILLLGSTQARGQVFDNNNIIALHQAGLGDATLIAKVNSMPCGYDVSTDGLIGLKKSGISDEVIAVMVDRCTSFARAQGVSSNSPDPNAAHPPGIYVKEDWLQPTQMQIIRPSKAGSIRVTGNGSILFPFVGRLGVPGGESHTIIMAKQPDFYFYFKADDQKVSDFGTADSVAAQSPDEFTLVKFKVKGNEREVNVGKASMFGAQRGIDAKEAIAFHSEEIGDGAFRVTPDQPMTAGQYAFVLTGAGGGARVYDFSVQ